MIGADEHLVFAMLVLYSPFAAHRCSLLSSAPWTPFLSMPPMLSGGATRSAWRCRPQLSLLVDVLQASGRRPAPSAAPPPPRCPLPATTARELRTRSLAVRAERSPRRVLVAPPRVGDCVTALFLAKSSLLFFAIQFDFVRLHRTRQELPSNAMVCDWGARQLVVCSPQGRRANVAVSGCPRRRLGDACGAARVAVSSAHAIAGRT